MPALNENADTLIARYIALNVNVATKTTLYTVPTGKTLLVTKVVFYGASTNLTTASWGVGFNANADDVVADETYTELTDNSVYTRRSAKDGAKAGITADVLGLKCSTPQGATATINVDVYGILV